MHEQIDINSKETIEEVNQVTVLKTENIYQEIIPYPNIIREESHEHLVANSNTPSDVISCSEDSTEFWKDISDDNNNNNVVLLEPSNHQLGSDLHSEDTKKLSKTALRRLRKKERKKEKMKATSRPEIVATPFAMSMNWRQPLPKGPNVSNPPRTKGYNNPPQNTIAKKRKMSEQYQFEPPAKVPKVTNERHPIHIAIVPVGYPSEVLSKNKFRLLQSAILSTISTIKKHEIYPHFLDNYLECGALVITCLDNSTVNWLKNTCDTLRPWSGARLRTLEPEELDRVEQYTVWIPELTEHPNQILCRLKKQNKDLNTDHWIVNEWIPSYGGQTLVLSIKCDDSIRVLEELNYQPFLNFGRVLFTKIGEMW